MKIFILASGSTKQWDDKIRSLLPVRGKPLLSRTVSMLKGYNYTILTHHKEIKIKYDPCYKPVCREKILDTVLSSVPLWEGMEEICFLMGDVVYTKKALTKILEPINKSLQFYGSWEEHFAFRFSNHWYEKTIEACKTILKISKGDSTWELYRSLVGIPLNKHWMEQWFMTFISDKTDDIDSRDDYEFKITSNYFENKEFDI